MTFSRNNAYISTILLGLVLVATGRVDALSTTHNDDTEIGGYLRSRHLQRERGFDREFDPRTGAATSSIVSSDSTTVDSIIPSSAPTAGPSSSPSDAPSSAPSVAPSSSPTAEPTASPSATPTASPTEGEVCRKENVSQKFFNVPQKQNRSIRKYCASDELLLDFTCTEGGRKSQARENFKIRHATTKYLEGVRDGRRVAIGAQCVMKNTLELGKRDATLSMEIVCGKLSEFPEVVLESRTENKGKVPRKRTRSISSTCSRGQQMVTGTCNSKDSGTFVLDPFSGFNGNLFDKGIFCRFKNDAPGRRSTTMTNQMICGDRSKAQNLCGFNTQFAGI